MRGLSVSSLVVSVFLLVSAPPTLSLADAVDEALAEEGYVLREQGKDLEALAKFEQAHALQQTPRYLAQIALAEQALGRWADAYEHLRSALRQHDDEWIADRDEPLRQALATIEAQLGQLEIACNVHGASVRVSGREVGQTPLTEPVHVAAGTVAVQISAPGYVEMTQPVTVHRGTLSRAEIALIAAPAVARVVGGDGESNARGVLKPRTDGQSGTRLTRNPRWLIGVGVGAAIAIGGAASYMASGEKADRANEKCIDPAGENVCTAEEKADTRATIRTLDRTSWALVPIGVIVAAASGAVYYWSKREDRRLSWSADLTPSHAVGYAQLRF